MLTAEHLKLLATFSHDATPDTHIYGNCEVVDLMEAPIGTLPINSSGEGSPDYFITGDCIGSYPINQISKIELTKISPAGTCHLLIDTKRYIKHEQQ